MYQSILVTLDTTATDRAIIDHIKLLAPAAKSRITLLHVASGAAARFHGPNAGGQEVEKSRKYLDAVQSELQSAGLTVTAELAYGDPVKEIVKWAESHPCDLVAMSTHGHKLVADMLLGTTASKVQHSLSIPVLMLRAK